MSSAPWSWDKFVDLLAHLWIPIIVIGTNGTAALIRILRANLTDELNKPYVITARAKGLPEYKVVLKYPVRIALNPFVSAIGWVLPELISGVTITAIVLNLPMMGPLLLRALIVQDMYLAGSVHPAARRADAHRHADLRHPARHPRSADPVHLMQHPHAHRGRGRDRSGDRRRSGGRARPSRSMSPAPGR